jgi:ribosome recycling factor
MINTIGKETEVKMLKSIDAFKHELSKLRTGRAHTSLLDHIRVNYYGTETPLSQVANVNVEDARTLSITPFDKKMVSEIEKAIMTSDLGLNPATTGTIIRVPLPALTEDRRRDLTRIVKDEAEKARVSIRNIRRDANQDLKELLKEKAITEDDERKGQAAVQKITDDITAKIEQIASEKEKDLMKV